MSAAEFVSPPKLEDYKEKFKDFLHMERKDGVLLVRMHYKGEPFVWSFESHNALPMAWHEIGSDPENEVMILTSSGPVWIANFDHESFKRYENKLEHNYSLLYYDATKLVENFINDIDIPTIAVMPGPGTHSELAMLCDITLCTETAKFQESHFLVGIPPGDGKFLCFQALLGTKRAAYMAFTGKPIDAQTALEWGIVNEIVPEDKILDRAYELAAAIMKQPREARRLTCQITRRPWKRLFKDDYQVHITTELYSGRLNEHKHDFKRVRDSWDE